VTCQSDTLYTAGAGLELADTQFSITTPYQLPQSCTDEQIGQWNGSEWQCTNASVGDITAVRLSGGGDSGEVETVTMQSFVDIEGAGELNTKISYHGEPDNSEDNPSTGTLIGADNAELRFLTVENTGGDKYAVAIYNNSASPRLTNVSARASDGTYSYGVYNNSSSPTMKDVRASGSDGTGINFGVYNDTSSPTMTNVSASASGGVTSCGVYNDSSSPEMTNVSASASGGENNYGMYNSTSSPAMTNVNASASGGIINYGVQNILSSLTINNSLISASEGTENNYGIHNSAGSLSYTLSVNNSQIIGSTNTIYNDPNYIVNIGVSQLSGGAVSDDGAYHCVGVYDGDYNALDETCQVPTP